MNRTRFGLIAGLMAMLLLFSGCSQNDSVDSVSGATQHRYCLFRFALFL